MAWLMAGMAAMAAPRSNVLFLFSDDQRADTLHALGNAHIATPNLYRLAEQGVAFTRAFCQGGFQGAVCVPARAPLLSGRSLFHLHEQLRLHRAPGRSSSGGPVMTLSLPANGTMAASPSCARSRAGVRPLSWGHGQSLLAALPAD